MNIYKLISYKQLCWPIVLASQIQPYVCVIVLLPIKFEDSLLGNNVVKCLAQSV